MLSNSLAMTQTTNVDKGALKINVNSTIGSRPIKDATIRISITGGTGTILEEIKTDPSGQSEQLILPTPPLEYSLEPENAQPYAEYTIQVSAAGYNSIDISGIEVLPTVNALQNVRLVPEEISQTNMNNIVIPAHTLYGDYPPKIAESEIKPVSESGEIVLSKVVIPEYIIVHDGSPKDSTANNYYVKYKDYIKNVASSEIYATWPKNTIRSNILAIMSFTLNRVYTEWYRNQGYDFTITSSTAFDHKWIYGRNVFDEIAIIVDEVFASFLSRPNVKQPILTQYCDGKRVTCPNWMSQWGSKYLGDQGYESIEIIRYYYGDNMYINTAEEISGVPASWPRVDLSIGSSGDKVKQIQEQLNAVAKAYPALPSVTPDGQYGPATQAAVKKFQSIFGLPVTGIVDYATWYRISDLYVGVTRIAELV